MEISEITGCDAVGNMSKAVETGLNKAHKVINAKNSKSAREEDSLKLLLRKWQELKARIGNSDWKQVKEGRWTRALARFVNNQGKEGLINSYWRERTWNILEQKTKRRQWVQWRVSLYTSRIRLTIMMALKGKELGRIGLRKSGRV